jgi:hypothetical protein
MAAEFVKHTINTMYFSHRTNVQNIVNSKISYMLQVAYNTATEAVPQNLCLIGCPGYKRISGTAVMICVLRLVIICTEWTNNCK